MKQFDKIFEHGSKLGVAVVKDLKDSLSFVEKIAFHITNYFGKRETFTIRITTPDYKQSRILWGAYTHEAGASFTARIHCTAGAFHVIQKRFSKELLILPTGPRAFMRRT